MKSIPRKMILYVIENIIKMIFEQTHICQDSKHLVEKFLDKHGAKKKFESLIISYWHVPSPHQSLNDRSENLNFEFLLHNVNLINRPGWK